MSRLLFVAPPLAGHVNPLLGVAAELRNRGHEVAWACPVPVIDELAAEPAVFPAGDAAAFAVDKRPPGLRGFAALKFLWEQYLVPLADAMAPGVRAAVADFAPDALVVDQQALAGALVASARGLPWATSASTSSELVDPLGSLDRIASWIDELQTGLRGRHCCPTGPDLRFSPYLVLAFSTRALVGEAATPVAGELSYVGPSLTGRSDVDFPWHQLDPGRRLAVVTLGTANADVSGRFLDECVRALGGLDGVQGVIADPAGLLSPDTPPNVLVVRRIPQIELLKKASVAVCHGGHNTVCESLAHGVPLVVAPIRDDQPVLAQQVVEAGAGRRLRFDRAGVDDIRDAVLGVLRDPSFAEHARQIQASFAQAGGAAAAAERLVAFSETGAATR